MVWSSASTKQQPGSPSASSHSSVSKSNEESKCRQLQEKWLLDYQKAVKQQILAIKTRTAREFPLQAYIWACLVNKKHPCAGVSLFWMCVEGANHITHCVPSNIFRSSGSPWIFLSKTTSEWQVAMAPHTGPQGRGVLDGNFWIVWNLIKSRRLVGPLTGGMQRHSPQLVHTGAALLHSVELSPKAASYPTHPSNQQVRCTQEAKKYPIITWHKFNLLWSNWEGKTLRGAGTGLGVLLGGCCTVLDKAETLLGRKQFAAGISKQFNSEC